MTTPVRAATFDEAFLRRLARLAIVARRLRTGQRRGEHRSPRRGGSLEYADMRAYTPGDDLRRVDWNVYARLERLLVKLYGAEEELTVHLLLDTSASMDWGTPHKLTYARRTAAALGYLALAGLDRIVLTTLAGGRTRQSPALRGRHSLARLLDLLAEEEPGGATDLEGDLRAFALRGRAPGPLFLISDLLSPGGCRGGLRALAAARYEVAVIHLLAPDEVDPALAGNLRLIDRETGAGRDISLDEGVLRAYREHLQAWQAELREECLERGLSYLPVVTSQPFDDLILGTLRHAGLIGR